VLDDRPGRRHRGGADGRRIGRDVDPRALQRELLRQGAYLSPAVEAALRAPTAAT
jgi:hypothetical protein